LTTKERNNREKNDELKSDEYNKLKEFVKKMDKKKKSS